MNVTRHGTIIQPHMDERMGSNINGPSLIRVPDWVENRLGRYYLYFGDHRGSYIRMAYADNLRGPWSMYTPGVLDLADSFFMHHLASPDVHVDEEQRRFVMYYHGRLPDGGQRSRVALSTDGLSFEARPEILGGPYLRAFDWRGHRYALTMPGVFYRSRDGLTGFERGPQLFTTDMRHSAVIVRDGVLYVFYTNAGDCPESILLATIDLGAGPGAEAWECWQASEPVVVLQPETDDEGADCPLEPSQRGPINERVRQLRDPALYEEEGRLWLLYSVAGESGIALAEVKDLQPIAGRRQPRPEAQQPAFVRPEYVCYRASGPITIDGVLDEPDWQRAMAVELVLADTGGQTRQRTVARALWDDEYLYVAFECEDEAIWGVTTRRDQDIYQQEVVEVFVDADCDDIGYVEIEVNPLNAVLDLFMLNRGNKRHGLWDWDSKGLQTAVRVDGDPTRRHTRDRSWTVEMAIPMVDFTTAPNLPPQPGDVWHMNLYRIDRGVGEKEGVDEYSAWSPPGIINYHTPQRFGRLIFSEGF